MRKEAQPPPAKIRDPRAESIVSQAVLGSTATERAIQASLHAVAGVPAVAERAKTGRPDSRRYQARQSAEGTGGPLQAATR